MINDVILYKHDSYKWKFFDNYSTSVPEAFLKFCQLQGGIFSAVVLRNDPALK